MLTLDGLKMVYGKFQTCCRVAPMRCPLSALQMTFHTQGAPHYQETSDALNQSRAARETTVPLIPPLIVECAEPRYPA